MKTAALVLGIIGGVIGLIGAILALIAGGVGSALSAEGAGTVIGLGWLALLFAILGIVGGALSPSKPKVGGILLIAAGIGGMISISAAFAPAGVILIIGGILALVGSGKPKASASPAAPSVPPPPAPPAA